MTPQQLGSWFEAELRKVFATMTRRKIGNFYRLYDTKSAGAFLPAQPADFFGACNGVAWLIEAKASTRHESLTNCLRMNISPEQSAAQALWRKCGGGAGLFVFYSATSKTVEVWDGAYVASVYNVPRKRLDTAYRLVFPEHKLFDELSRALQDVRALTNRISPEGYAGADPGSTP